MTCKWPNGTCACYAEQQEKPDPLGRVWMHCESGLTFSKASMARFMIFCLGNDVEIGSVHAFNSRYRNCQVLAVIRLKPEQFDEFENKTGGKLRKPPIARLNTTE